MKRTYLTAVAVLSMFVLSFSQVSAAFTVGTEPPFGGIVASTSSGTLSTKNFGREYPNNPDGIAYQYVSPNTNYFCSISVFVWQTGTPVDSVRMKIYKGGTFDSGTLIDTSTAWLGSALTTNTAGTLLNFSLDECLGMTGGETYWFILQRTGSSDNSKFYGVSTFTNGTPTYFPSSIIDARMYGSTNGYGTTSRGKLAVYGQERLDPLSPTGSSSGTSLSGAGTFCSSIASSSYAFGIPYGFCYALSFLFVPSEDSVQLFIGSAQTLKTHIPYSYITGMQTIYGNVSSSSGTFPSLVVPYNLTGASLSHATLFSLSAIQTYGGATFWSALYTLMQAVIWLAFGLFVWRTIVHEMRK